MAKYDITTIICAYNPEWEQLRKTVASSIMQKNINHQIIITDDGSENNYFTELKMFFEENNFYEYLLISSEQNQGTCRNLYKALEKINSVYFKAIAPGDYYFNAYTLSVWLKKTKETEADICFGEAVCYQGKGDRLKIVSVDRQPQNVSIYESKYNKKTAYLNYVFLDDAIFGSCLILKTEFMKKYLESSMFFLKYAEDMVLRSMIIDGAKVVYYNKQVVWYEYGTGISTNKNSKWAQILRQEKNDTIKYIEKHNSEKCFSKIRLIAGLRVIRREKLNYLKYLIYPELIYWKIKKNSIKAKTIAEVDLDFMKNL